MLQRIQSIWLFVGAVFIFLTLRLSFYSGILAAGRDYHSMLPNDNLFILILTCALGTLMIVNIFLYKNRILQFRIGVISMLMEIMILIFDFKDLEKYVKGSMDVWALLHLVVIFAIIKSIIGIYKDEQLIKDSNRLR
ncbi:MAG: hypothetical protein NVSMB45_15630 [Ginsengibacter sp.]